MAAEILSLKEVDQARQAAHREQQTLVSILVRDGMVSSRDLATLMALNLGLTMADLRSQTIEPTAVNLIPEEVARKYLVLPVKRSENRLTVAMTDPTDLQVLQDISARISHIQLPGPTHLTIFDESHPRYYYSRIPSTFPSSSQNHPAAA